MRKVICFTCLLACVHLGATAAQADIYTFEIDPGDLPHQYFYAWGIQWTMPTGQYVSSATFQMDQVNDWRPWEPDIIYLRLLNNPPVGWHSAWDGEGGGDNLAGYGIPLDTYEDENGWAAEDWTYEFTPQARVTLADYAADGVFGFGIDPDCHYDHDGISVTIVTAPIDPIPAPAGVLLGAIGLSMVSWVRRRFA